jgi:hypothetical protein
MIFGIRILLKVSVPTGSGSTTLYRYCAAKAIFYCPSMNSHHPRSQNTAKERTLNPEKDSTRKRPTSHVSLEKSSKISRWKIEPNQTSSLTSLHSRPTFLASVFGGFATWWSQNRQNFLPFSPAK